MTNWKRNAGFFIGGQLASNDARRNAHAATNGADVRRQRLAADRD